MLMASFCLAACEAFVGSGPAAPYKSDSTSADPDAGTATTSMSLGNGSGGSGGSKSNTAAQAGSSSNSGKSNNNSGSNTTANNGSSNGGSSGGVCDTAPQKAEETLTTYCSMCHSNPTTAKGGFSTILTVPALLASGKVVANQPDMSVIYKRISTGTMPPADVQKRPGMDDIQNIKDWIDCGAQDWNANSGPTAEFVSIDDRVRTVLDDVRSFDNPVDRERMRYIDLSALSNGGMSDEQVQVYREAVSMLMNSLSRGRTVVAPVAIDKAKLIYRIDLRDYLWDATTWNQLESIYPYAVIYDQDSRLFPFDEVTSDQIRRETDTQIPIIQGDWFISNASRPPLYYSLLDLPDTLDGLGQQLGVNIQNDIDTEQVERAGFANAGPSQNNRVMERHELGGNRGALWVSYDFSSNLDDKDIFSHPLDFVQDGGEMIFNLENGLQGYFIANLAGTRLDKAPNNVVQDPASRDGAVEAGLSCMNCHQTQGQLPHDDEIRDFELNAGASAQVIEEVLALYVPHDQMTASLSADQNRYVTARSALNITNVSDTTMHQLDDTHLGLVDLNTVAAVIGITADDLKRAIDASPQSFPPEIVTLRTKGGSIQRDSFESVVGDLITALGLGQQLLANRNDNAGNNNNNNAGASSSANGGSSASSGAGGSSGGSSRDGSNTGSNQQPRR
jgi:hypothetical protein